MNDFYHPHFFQRVPTRYAYSTTYHEVLKDQVDQLICRARLSKILERHEEASEFWDRAIVLEFQLGLIP